MEYLTPYLFWAIAIMTCASALLTLLAQNVVRSATWLLFALAGTAGLFFLLGADFIGSAQILIYVGGTLILLIFGVMLTAQDPFITMKTSAAEWALSMVVGGALLSVLAIGAFTASAPTPFGETAKHAPRTLLVQEIVTVKDDKGKKVEKIQTRSNATGTSQYTDTLGLGFLGGGVGPANKVEGKVIRTSYLLPFEIVSVHLLVVLIGAAYLARAKRRKPA